jgi:hypothetical protein
VHVEVEDSFLFLPLGRLLLAQPDDLAHDLGVVAGPFGFGEDVPDVVRDPLLSSSSRSMRSMNARSWPAATPPVSAISLTPKSD